MMKGKVVSTNLLPNVIKTEEELEEILSRPSPEVIQAIAELEGDLMLLGVGEKWAFLGADGQEGRGGRWRFETCPWRGAVFGAPIERAAGVVGIETIRCDLLERSSLEALPKAPNILYMAARKFGSTGDEHYTWAMNTYLPGLVAERFHESRIVSFSTGNVYPLSRVLDGGSCESDPVDPVGEYAQSALGRERMIEYVSNQHGTHAVLLRLNYAVELRYGVLLDVALKVFMEFPYHLLWATRM